MWVTPVTAGPRSINPGPDKCGSPISAGPRCNPRNFKSLRYRRVPHLSTLLRHLSVIHDPHLSILLSCSRFIDLALVFRHLSVIHTYQSWSLEVISIDSHDDLFEIKFRRAFSRISIKEVFFGYRPVRIYLLLNVFAVYLDSVQRKNRPPTFAPRLTKIGKRHLESIFFARPWGRPSPRPPRVLALRDLQWPGWRFILFFC